MRVFLKWWRRFRRFQPVSILEVPPRPISPTSGLYVLRTDFPVDTEKGKELDAMLKPIREKYGLDFILLEPGITLSKFDD
jgi:hypothetical protein